MTKVSFGTFEMEAPEGWSLSSIVLAGPVEPPERKGLFGTRAVRPFQRNVIVTMERVDPKETAESYVARQLAGLKEAGVSREEARPPERVTLASGVDGMLTEQVILGHGDERVRQMQLVFIKDEIAHAAIASHLDGSSFEGVRDEFRSMLLSFS